MYTLNNIKLNQISGGVDSSCYDVYKTVAEDHPKGGFMQSLAMIFIPFGFIGVIGYQMGLRDAVKSICGASFDKTEAQYCLDFPNTCMKPKKTTA